MKLENLLRHIADNVEQGIEWYCNLDVPNMWNMANAIEMYRSINLSPKTHTVNGFEVPAPLVRRLESGTRYYLANPTSANLHYPRTWDGDESDERAFKRGLCFTAKEEAVANAAAMIGFDPYPSKKET